MDESNDSLVQIKVFLNYVDLYQNNAIALHLLNDVSEIDLRYAIAGTIYDHDGVGVGEFKRQMSQCLFKTYADLPDRVIENDYIIYDIWADPNEILEIERVLDALQKYYENDLENILAVKYLILITTPLTWGATEARNSEEILYETEYRRRKAHPSYLKHKYIERVVNLFEKKMGGKVRTLIICPGYSYGGVNDIFHYIFKLAFFNQKKVPIIEPGHQIIPLIYIKDLARIVKQIIKEFPPPEYRYIFAVQPHFWTIKSFTRDIVNSLAGNVTRVGILPKNCLMKYPDEVFPQRVVDAITTPLKLVSNYLKNFEYKFIKPEEIGKILANEYRSDRNLSPIKILIDGPPLAGKTTLAKDLAEHYNLNYIDPSTAVRTVANRLQKDLTAADKVLFNLEREKIEFGNEEDSEVLKIEENVREQIEEWQEFLLDITNHLIDPEKDEEDVFKYKKKCLKEILGSKLYCENQGYVIDGFPFTYHQAAEILFDTSIEADEEENEEVQTVFDQEFGEDGIFNKFKTNLMMPNFVILIDASDDLIWQRGMQLPMAEVLHTGNDEEGICSRLEEFRNRDENEEVNLTNFFFDNNIAPFCIFLNDDTKYSTILDMVKNKIGAPHTYPLTPYEKSKIKLAEMDRILRAEKEFERRQNEIAIKVRFEREEKLRKWTTDFERLKQEEELAAEAQTLPLRQYLAKFVLPTLTEGILEVSRLKPDDPVDYLAEFLFKNNATGHVLPDIHTEEMKKLLLTEGKESILKVLDSYVLNENEFKCSDFLDEPSTSKK